MIQLLLTLFIVFSFTTQAEQAQTESFTYSAEKHDGINIHNSFGDVSLAPNVKNEITLVMNKIKWGKRCFLKIDAKNKKFNVDINDQGWIMDNECRVDLIISIPERLNVQLRTGNGNVDIVGSRGNVDVKVGSGTVRVKSDLKLFSALTGAGNIRFDGRAEKTSVSTGKGDIQFHLLEKTNAQIIAKAGLGDIMISLPEKSKVHAQTTVGNGLVRNSFKNTENKANVDVQVRTGRGDIQIREN